MTDAVFIAAPDLLSIAHVRHAFFTRQGGVSDGVYASLNGGVGSHDARARVMENRARMMAALDLPADAFVNVHQVHSPDVVLVTEKQDGDRPKADGMATATPGLALCVASADCGPFLFADRERRVIGTCHAGWKGALTGVLENTVDAMIELGARRDLIIAVLGPSIAGKSYEVGPEFIQRFLDADATFERCFAPSQRAGHALFDLPSFSIMRLERAGVAAIDLGLDTYADADRFYSYRRSVHRGEADYGRLISAIALKGE
ncbi:MAG: peptidoglycan editing factor PgeF [Beijerinckiaceae bacterium]